MDTSTKVVIVGAGFGGLCMAAALKRAGQDSFVVLEKGHDVGGIWRDNIYPGCGCDVPSHLYSFSFEKYRSARSRYPAQPEILDYLTGVTDKYQLRRHLRTGAEVVSAEYDQSARRWTVRTEAGDTFTADVVVCAVGQLHRPKLPDITGRADFTGAAFHTARWNPDQDLTDRDVAVIGTGSSAAQLLPHVARQARRVRVYQRTPNWVLPKPKPEFGPITRAVFRRAPGIQSAYRALVYFAADLALTPVITKGWSALPAKLAARWHLRRQVPDPALRARLTPDYPIGCKRIVVDSDFYPAFARENVDLVTEPISRITRDGIELAGAVGALGRAPSLAPDGNTTGAVGALGRAPSLAPDGNTTGGRHDRADVIVYATGFRTTEFLVPMTVRGRDGAVLQDSWRAGAEAYLGIAVEGFPNFFLVHGPNTILGHNSNIFMIECQVHFIMNCLRLLPGAVEVRAEAMRDYRDWLNTAIGRTVWPAGCLSWYKTESGRVTNPWPASTLHYRKLVRKDPTAAFSVT